MSSDKKIEDSEVIDPIEAIKNKIKAKGYDIPLITDDFTWKILLDQNVLTGPEIGKIRSAILTATSASQPQGKRFHSLISAISSIDTFLYLLNL